MTSPIQLISTDFDGTLYAEFENPPVPLALQRLIGDLQAAGAKWVINTGRELSSLLESIGRSHLQIKPDYLVLVEREIYYHDQSQYVGLEEWNRQCSECHHELFAKVRPDLPRLVEWVNQNFAATVYEDPYSPFCLIAEKNEDADLIHQYLNNYCRSISDLTVVRNDVYARFSHWRYNKGSALAEVARRLEIPASGIFTVGDHLNDLPMLDPKYARWIATTSNAIAQVKEQVIRHGGYVSPYPCGDGVRDCLEFFLQPRGAEKKNDS